MPEKDFEKLFPSEDEINKFYRISANFKRALLPMLLAGDYRFMALGSNRTLSFAPKESSVIVYVCQFAEEPEAAKYARFIYRNPKSNLDIASENGEYQCPFDLGRIGLVDHVNLAEIATQHLLQESTQDLADLSLNQSIAV